MFCPHTIIELWFANPARSKGCCVGPQTPNEQHPVAWGVNIPIEGRRHWLVHLFTHEVFGDLDLRPMGLMSR